jgi:hypothetical protein
MKTKLNSSGFRAGTLSLWTSNVFLLEKNQILAHTENFFRVAVVVVVGRGTATTTWGEKMRSTRI